MQKTIPTRWIVHLTICLLIVSLPVAVAANEKGEQLRRAMADISLLNSQMAQRKADAAEVRDQLAIQLKTITEEAQREIRDNKIASPSEALSNAKLSYDLRLMAEIQAYIGRYTQRIGYYRVACDRLGYLYQQADDDLKIIHTLSDLKIEALIGQVEKVLDGYLADAQTLVIRPETLTFEPPEKVWASLSPGK